MLGLYTILLLIYIYKYTHTHTQQMDDINDTKIKSQHILILIMTITPIDSLKQNPTMNSQQEIAWVRCYPMFDPYPGKPISAKPPMIDICG